VQRNPSFALVSVRAISDPFRRPDMRTLMPSAPERMVLVTRASWRGGTSRASRAAAKSLGDQLRIELGLADLGDVEAHVLHRHSEILATAARSFSMSSPFFPITMPGRAVWM